MKADSVADRSLDAIRQSILADAEREARRIVEEAKREAKSLVEEARQRAEAGLSGWADRQRQMITNEGERLLGSARGQAHMRILEAKARLISQAMEEARRQLDKDRATPRYKALLMGLIRDAATQIGGGDLVVLVRRDDQKVLGGLSSLASSITKATGVKTTLTLGKEALDCLGGVIVQTKDGDITVDYRLETLLEQVEKQYRAAIARTLFGEEE